MRAKHRSAASCTSPTRDVWEGSRSMYLSHQHFSLSIIFLPLSIKSMKPYEKNTKNSIVPVCADVCSSLSFAQITLSSLMTSLTIWQNLFLHLHEYFDYSRTSAILYKFGTRWSIKIKEKEKEEKKSLGISLRLDWSILRELTSL